MYSLFGYERLAKENRRLIEEKIQHSLFVQEAERASKQHKSKLLVKLALLLIQSGERIMSHVERDSHNEFTGASLQKS